MDVRVPVTQVARGLDDGNHPGPYVLVAGGNAHQLEHGLPGRAGKTAEQLSVVEKIRPQHLRDDKDPLGMPDLLEDLVGEQRRCRRRPLRRARRAQLTGLARERQSQAPPPARYSSVFL